MKKLLLITVIFLNVVAVVKAQTVSEDSVKTEVRRYTARNFSEERTFNLYWETSPSHNYTLEQNGEKIEKGRMRYEHVIKFSTIIPVIDKKKFTLNVKGYANFHKFEARNEVTGSSSVIYKGEDDLFNYYKAELNASYIFNVFNKPLILRAAISGDGWHKGIEKMDGSLTALYLLKNSERTKFYVGMHLMALYDKIPASVIVIYTHQFNKNWGVDISLPSRAFLRYQFCNRHRLSMGNLLESDQYYYKPEMEGLPETVLFKSTNLKAELDYEYILNKRFFFIVRGGVNKTIKSGFYKTNRKGNGDGDPLMEYTQPFTPFFYLGFSYNIFK